MSRPGPERRYLLLANGSAQQTTGRLFTALAEGLRSQGHDVELVLRSFPRGIVPKVRHLVKAMRDDARRVRRVDVVVVHSALSLSLWSMAAARLSGRRVIAFVWDIYPDSTQASASPMAGWLRLLYAVTERLGYVVANRRLVPSEDYRAVLQPRTAGRAVEICPLWPVDRVAEPASAEDHGDWTQVAFAGQINGIRGLETGVAALIESISSPVTLHLFSADHCPEPVRRLQETRPDRLRVVEHGFVAADVLQGWLSTLDAGWVCLDPGFKLPAFPSKIMGYLCAGLPVLYTGPDMPGLERWLEETGLGIRLGAGFVVDRAEIRGLREDLHARRQQYFDSVRDAWADLC